MKKKLFSIVIAWLAMAPGSPASDFTRRSPEGPVALRSTRADRNRAWQHEHARVDGIVMTKEETRKAATAPGSMPGKRASAAKPDGVSLCGLMIYSSAWGSTNSTGIYTIDAATGATSLQAATPELGQDGTVAGILLEDTFYATRISDFFGQISELEYYTVNVVTGKTEKREVTNPSYSGASVNMTYDASSRTVYSINYSGGPDYYDLCTFNPEDFTFTTVAGLNDHYYAICSDSKGALYAINDLGDVVELDTSSGMELRTVARTNIEPAFQQSCCWSPKDNKIYWAACNYTTAALVTIDPATGVVETAARFPNEEEFVALTCTDPAQNPGAPGAPADLSVSYNEPGGYTAHISCRAPQSSVGGVELTRGMTLRLTIDGETVNEAELMPGDTYGFVYPLKEGAHQVRAVCRNEWGEGVAARLTTFAGTDRPADVTDLSARTPDATTVALEWSAPRGGEEGGWFDPGSVSYNVVCNGTTLARGLTGTSYTDKTAETFDTREYSLEVCYDGTVAAHSNRVTVTTGLYLGLPYRTDLEKAGDFGMMSVIDHNGDGNSWFYDEEYNTASYNYSRTTGGDDYLVMPRIRAEKGHVYRMEFFSRSASSMYPDKLEVVCGEAAEAASLSRVLFPGRVISNEGETLSVEAVAEADGDLYFAFHCVSDRDMSRLFVDDITITDAGLLDAPAPAGDLKVTPDADGSLRAEISFTTPSTTLGGAPLASLERVEITRNGETIHTIASPAPGSRQSYTDDNATFGLTTYGVTAVSGGKGGNMATERVFVGVYSLPFSIGPAAEEYPLFSIPGGEKDGTWYYDPTESALKIITYGYAGSDAWIFTPGVELTDGNLVDLSFSLRAGLASCTETLEVTVGRSADVSSQRSLAEFDFNHTEYATRTLTFEVPAGEAGRYYIGFHCKSRPQQMMALVRDIKLERGAKMSAPGYPSGVEVKGDGNGALTGEVTFGMPTTTLGGTSLSGSLEARLYRSDGSLAASKSGIAPGEKVTLKDTEATNGFNNYSVCAVNSEGEGGRSEGTGWVGTDIPGHIPMLDITPSDDNLRAELEWSAPTFSLHGGYMNPRELRYNIYQLVDNSLYLINTTSYTSATVTPQGGNVQDFYTFYVTAVSEAGESQAVSNGVVAGPPHHLPMTETASNKVVTSLPWISGTLEGDVNWGVADYIGSLDLAADDGGMFVCSAALPARQPGVGRMQLPKLVFDGLNAPSLTFKMYHYAGEGATLHVQCTTDEVNYKTVCSLRTSEKAEGWAEYTVNLSEYADANWVAIVFDGELSDGKSYIIVDDIEVSNRSERDLLVARVGGRTTIEAGSRQSYTVEVKNAGSKGLDFDVEMRVDGSRHVYVSHEGELAGGSAEQIEMAFTALPEHIGRPLNVEIEVIPRGWTDEIPANNVARFEIHAVQPALPTVTDLNAEDTPDGVDLEWSTPSLIPEGITDNFCDYESFEYENIGRYITADLDGLIPCGISGVQFPNMGTPMAFQVWEPKAAGVDVDAEIWQPHSGHKCLVAWTALSSYTEPYNDDWLISPELYSDGESAQRIGFFVRRPVGTYGTEYYEIWYSEKGPALEDFKQLESETVSNGVWNERIYTLPAEARHFAIRYTSRNKFALLFDDLSYVPASESGELTVNGFHVYRNGEKIGTTGSDVTRYSDNTAAGPGRFYNVTVDYNRGESIFSNTARTTAGIATTEAAKVTRISGHRGYILVESAEGEAITVSDIAGRTVYEGVSTGMDRVFATSGIYVVKAGDSTAKIAVK